MPLVRAAFLLGLLSCAGPTPIPPPADFFGSDYVLTVAGNSNMEADLGPAEWWRVSDDLFQVRGYYRVASGDPNSGVHLLLLRREVRKDGAVRYELVEDTLED